MELRRRAPALVLAVVALALVVVIGGRVAAGADPAPQDTTPVVIAPSTAPTAPSPTPSATPSQDDDGKVAPRLRDDDDDDGPDDDDDDHDLDDLGPDDDDD